MIANLVLLMVLELVSGFCKTLPQFVGMRSLFGVAMGGEHFLCLLANMNHEITRFLQA
jgi:hypothetical protein